MPGAQVSFLPDGRRLHLHHGPIDLIVDATGPGRAAALGNAAVRFETILQELVGELDLLRSQVCSDTDAPGPGPGQNISERLAGPPRNSLVPRGRVARAMYAAVVPLAPGFVTPMAAVAGAVADEILDAMAAAGGLATAYVNNGGDIALHVGPGESLTAAIAAGLDDRVTVTSDSPVRGIATSGWRGRSQSLGIADTVTVLAGCAAQADAAATLIANAVDLPGNAKVVRAPACEVSPDSDLGRRKVTVAVSPLAPGETDAALDRGRDFANTCLKRNLICGALLTLAGERRIVGAPDLLNALSKDQCHA